MEVLWQLYVAWFKMGLFTFGGGYAMLPMIQKEVIEKYHWATDSEIMDYYAVGQCTPGIIAVNTATFVGNKVKGVIGGIVATLGVISPSIIIIFLISSLISNFSDLEIVQHALNGIKVAVCVLMFLALEKLIKNGIKDLPSFVIALVTFLLSYFTNISTVIVVICAGVVGFVLHKVRKESSHA